jgi:hypothetical protein
VDWDRTSEQADFPAECEGEAEVVDVGVERADFFDVVAPGRALVGG